jgi:hypothetical protein
MTVWPEESFSFNSFARMDFIRDSSDELRTGANGSGFLGLPEGPTLLVAGRLQSEHRAAFLGLKCRFFLGIWAHSSCRFPGSFVRSHPFPARARRRRALAGAAASSFAIEFCWIGGAGGGGRAAWGSASPPPRLQQSDMPPRRKA